MMTSSHLFTVPGLEMLRLEELLLCAGQDLGALAQILAAVLVEAGTQLHGTVAELIAGGD